MSEQKESSVLFSLKELMNLEEDRIRGEEDAKASKMAAEEEARRSAELAARNAEEARIRAEEERRRAEEQRGREEAARLEAIRVAEIERARLEAEGQARMAAMNSQQQHMLQMEAIRGDSGKKRLRNILIGTVVAVLMVGGVTGFLLNEKNTKDKLEVARLEADKKAAEDKNAKLESQFAEQANKVKGLEDDVASEKDATKKAKLQAALDAAKQEEAETAEKLGKRVPTRSGGDKATPSTAKAVCTCKSTDPLCDCL